MAPGFFKRIQRRLQERRSKNRKSRDASVLDYNSQSLQRAMKKDPNVLTNKVAVGVGGPGSTSGSSAAGDGACDHSHSCGGSTSGRDDFSAVMDPVEWTLPLVDEQVTEPQSMEQEMKRLQALQSYFVLDSEGEAAFDNITTMTSQIFQVPTCLISLVDLGRQWFLSRVGLDATETPRKHAFCAHVILNKYKILVVPDATQDFRFQNNPLVTGAPHIRFYAGAALVSPEGYKLGTLCCIDYVPHPEGLSNRQQEILHNLASMVVHTMVSRRESLLKAAYDERFQLVANVLLGTKTHLDRARHTLDDTIAYHSWNMNDEDQARMGQVTKDLETQSHICATTTRQILQDTEMNQDVIHDPSSYADVISPITNMPKLFDNINAIVSNFPKPGVVVCELDKTVPKDIIVEDLLLFRSILNLLTHCMGTKQDGMTPAAAMSGLRIRKSTRADELLVQCAKPGKPVPKELAKEIFKMKDSLLGPVASMVQSLGGKYGMFEGKWDPQGGNDELFKSIFWFQVPYFVEDADQVVTVGKTQIVKHEPSKAVVNARDVQAIQADPFQKALMEVGCGVPVS